MGKIFVPANEAGDWRPLLAKPDLHWKTGRSAKTLAHCWQEADEADADFPKCVRDVFRKSGIRKFENLQLLLAFPEYKTPLLGGRRAAQSDVFVLAKGGGQLISIAVEGKADEDFGKTVAEWRQADKAGKEERLRFLLKELHLQADELEDVAYQLLHRTAAAIIEAENFGARNALMLVHSFAKPADPSDNVGFEQFTRFLMRYDLEARQDSVMHAKNFDGLELYFAWINGNPEYLKR